MYGRIAELAWNRLRSDGETISASTALRKVASTGFDTVLLSDGGDDPAVLSSIAAACGSEGLALWLVLSPDKNGLPVFAAEAAPLRQAWLIDGDLALDPRRPPRPTRSVGVDVDGPAWDAKIETAIRAGVAGFVCRDADLLPTALWSRLTKLSGPDRVTIRWVAWTPGLRPADLEALLASGFDTACSSLAWWDGRERWLLDEFERFSGVHTLAFPADPFAASRSNAAAASALSFGTRLKIAAALCDAVIVPMDAWDDSTGDVVAAVNRWLGERRDGMLSHARPTVRIVSGADSPVTVVVRTPIFDLRASDRATLVLLNPHPVRTATISGASITASLSGFGRFTEVGNPRAAAPLDACRSIELAGGELRVFEATRLPVIQRSVASGRRSAEAAVQMARVAIEAITPSVDDGRFPVKRTAGEAVRVEADIVIDGHEKLGASLLYRAAGEREWRQVRMEPLGNDRFTASFALQRVGRHEFTIEAWRDAFATYRNEIEKKTAAGLDVSLELIEGRLLVEQALAQARTLKRADLVRRLTALLATLAADGVDAAVDRATKVAGLLASRTLADMQLADHRAFAVRPTTIYPVDAERSGASFASWYELFPRSLGNPAGATPLHHGNFDDVIERLPAVRAMGFDVLYFPPIHPIGKRNRKGRNNSLSAVEGDPGSPYAIGSAEGGHDALHPQLGSFDDFRRLRDAALDNGLELALDFAIQCSPDHPWLQQHPGWFAWRPDGSLRYAENPPKKYEDIVNVDFYGTDTKDDAAPALWMALRDVILLWVEQGVRIFRVDNPHTKPLPFWEWMIGEVRSRYPDTLFLSEAFTRPKVMYRLAKVGFSQSYTYFTWRHTKQEFIDYLTELTTTAPRDFFRPNFFVNTPDINPVFLQRSGRPGFLIRAALAATLSGLWGVYSGFELCEGTPVPGKEDYLDSEKYQLRAWDWQRPGNIVAEITALNRIRRENPALHTHLNVSFENAFDANILYFVKATEDRSNIVVVAINLDPFGVHEADFELPFWKWKLPDDATVRATDLLDGRRFAWQGKLQRMRLDPEVNPYAIWRVAL